MALTLMWFKRMRIASSQKYTEVYRSDCLPACLHQKILSRGIDRDMHRNWDNVGYVSIMGETGWNRVKHHNHPNEFHTLLLTSLLYMPWNASLVREVRKFGIFLQTFNIIFTLLESFFLIFDSFLVFNLKFSFIWFDYFSHSKEVFRRHKANTKMLRNLFVPNAFNPDQILDIIRSKDTLLAPETRKNLLLLTRPGRLTKAQNSKNSKKKNLGQF